MTSRVFALVGLVLGAAGCNEDLLNPMADRQPRVQAYGLSEFHDDGLAMRQAIPGTVPRERFVKNGALTTGKVLGADNKETYVTSFPMKVDRAFLELGRKRYDITCSTCHGPTGDGDSIVAKQMSLRPPPSLLAYADKPVGYIFEVATNGFGMMASYAGELPVRERWAVVAYIKALQISQTYAFDKLSADERARLGTP